MVTTSSDDYKAAMDEAQRILTTLWKDIADGLKKDSSGLAGLPRILKSDKHVAFVFDFYSTRRFDSAQIHQFAGEIY